MVLGENSGLDHFKVDDDTPGVVLIIGRIWMKVKVWIGLSYLCQCTESSRISFRLAGAEQLDTHY